MIDEIRCCRDCEVFQEADKESCELAGCASIDFECDDGYGERAWCGETQEFTCEKNIMCGNRLSNRELLNLLVHRTKRMAHTLDGIETYIEKLEARERALEAIEWAKKEAARREKWEAERPLRLEKFEKTLAELPEWVKQEKAVAVTGLRSYKLKSYEREGLLVCRRNDRGHREYRKEDILRYAEEYKKTL